MRWRLDPKQTAAWSAAGGAVMTVASGVAIASSFSPPLIAVAIVGFYVLLAPLLHLWPWRHEVIPTERREDDRVALLREQHRKGRSLQKMLVRAGGIQKRQSRLVERRMTHATRRASGEKVRGASLQSNFPAMRRNSLARAIRL
jgi:hypothetical protein